MSQIADIQSIPLEQILEILRKQALAIPTSTTSTRYLRALESLSANATTKEYCEADTEQGADTPYCEADIALRAPLTDWLVSLWLNATPFATASLYLDIISSLYGSAAKAGLLPPTKLFSHLKADLKVLGSEGWKQGINDEIFDRALRLTKNATHLIADDATAASLIIYSLTHALMPLTDIAMLKRSDVKESRVQSQESKPSAKSQGSRVKGQGNGLEAKNSSLITDHSLLKRSRYWLPLRQSQRTPKQLSTHIAKIVNALFKRARLPQATNPFDTVESLWAYAALRAGIPASTLVSHLGHTPLGLPVLKLSAINPHYALHDTRFAAIGQIFLDNPPHWYAMSLRPGVRFTQICRRIQLLGDRIPDIQLFYPCEEIARAIGKKIVTRQRPFIHSVVFFRAKLTDIGRLFSKIGDLAWCYRQSARPGAPYAEISQSQFHLFQQTIAHFTPDYEVASIGELELNEGDRVEIIGGLFAGQQATVVEESRSSAKSQESRVKGQGNGLEAKNSSLITNHSSLERSTVYRLNIVGDNGIEWRINVDPRLLLPRRQS